MSLDSRPILPRSAPDPAYLQRLRHRALVRMRRDEDALASPPVTRRQTLQNLTLAAAATPFLGSLLRDRRAFAEAPKATGFLRVPAPQYGVPGMPGNPQLRIPTSFATHENIGSINAWTDTRVLVIPPGSIYSQRTPARVTYLKLDSGEIFPLNLINDPNSTWSYVVNANEIFYVPDGNDLLGVRFGAAELVFTPSVLKYKTPPEGDSAVIQHFAATVDDRTLTQASSREIHVPLIKGVPTHFWQLDTDTAPRAPKQSSPFIYDVNVKEGVLNIACYSPVMGSLAGTFSINLKTKRLIGYHGVS